jgi:parallel beta-helix repeat protein
MGIDVGNPTLLKTYNVTVSNNTVRDVDVWGISFDGDTENSTIENNTVEDCGRGIGLGPNQSVSIVPSNNLIEGNQLSNNSVANLLIFVLTPEQSSYMNTFRRNNLTNTLAPNIYIWGPYLGVFNQDIDSSNTANGKPIYYITNQSNVEIDPSNYTDAGYLALVNCTNLTAQNFDLTDNLDGMLMAGVTNSTLTNMTLGNNQPYFTQEVEGWYINGNITDGMALTSQSIPAYWGGLTLFESSNNTITDSTIYNNTVGISFYQSDNNLFFHNSFINNDINVLSNFTGAGPMPVPPYETLGNISTNLWNDGYPSGGNYWSDYNGTDLFSGPHQNVTGNDGIGDTSYVIDANNTDNYPLMGQFFDFNVAQGIDVQVVSNSTVSDVQFNGTALLFNVTGENGTTGFCRINFPTALINGTLTVIVNGTEVPYTLLSQSNSTQSCLYFTYSHLTEQVTIIPEFPSFFILSLFMIMLIVLAFCKRKAHEPD